LKLAAAAMLSADSRAIVRRNRSGLVEIHDEPTKRIKLEFGDVEVSPSTASQQQSSPTTTNDTFNDNNNNNSTKVSSNWSYERALFAFSYHLQQHQDHQTTGGKKAQQQTTSSSPQQDSLANTRSLQAWIKQVLSFYRIPLRVSEIVNQSFELGTTTTDDDCFGNSEKSIANSNYFSFFKKQAFGPPNQMLR
jgi:hypothetical protein